MRDGEEGHAKGPQKMPLQLNKRIVVLVQVLREPVKVSDVGRKGVRLCGATRSRDKRRRLAQL